MLSVFYIAAIIAILTSFKVISSSIPFSALLYLVVSLLATSVVLFTLGAYFTAALQVIVFIGAVAILFISAISLLNITKDAIEQEKKSLTPKVWLGPLMLAFVLLVILLYSIVHTDYGQINTVPVTGEESLGEMLMAPYILVIELAVLLLLGALVIAYHFAREVYAAHDEMIEKNEEDKDMTDEQLGEKL